MRKDVVFEPQVEPSEFFRNVRACAGGSDYAEQRLTNSSSPIMRWIPMHVQELGDNNVLMAKNVVVSVFQLLVRGYGYEDIAKQMHVTYKFVRMVEQSAMMCVIRVNVNSLESPDIFAKDEYGKKFTVLDYERRVYKYWKGVLEKVLAKPTDIDESAAKGATMVKAWSQMTKVYVFIPERGLYYAGAPMVGQKTPVWSADIGEALGFKTMARAKKIIDNLKMHNPVSMRGAVIVNELGEEVKG